MSYCEFATGFFMIGGIIFSILVFGLFATWFGSVILNKLTGWNDKESRTNILWAIKNKKVIEEFNKNKGVENK